VCFCVLWAVLLQMTDGLIDCLVSWLIYWLIDWRSVDEGRKVGVKRDLDEYGADVHGVRQMIVYALKGLGAYARHARQLGEWDDSIGNFTNEVKFLVHSS